MVRRAGLIAPIRAARGRPQHRPGKLHADKAYDIRALRAEIRRRGIGVRIARKGVESSQRPGRHGWIVEACPSWLMNNRRLVSPGDGDALRRSAETLEAPEDVLADLDSLRAGVPYCTVAEIWAALGRGPAGRAPQTGAAGCGWPSGFEDDLLAVVLLVLEDLEAAFRLVER